ncbi:extracellular solute-binding protein [Rhodobacter sp. KR11]|uniref:extracellular solute-binding protein n=1 Tax=Rhodobacter sp. KR11 TaxID=2974588 RepID=UPI002222BD80|nr:extracellular solute-binding protein [Rhodobacter sp. KR11]MCW1918937.1 extracellular solute-binding protein [Rhodobacter sp. KR11]
MKSLAVAQVRDWRLGMAGLVLMAALAHEARAQDIITSHGISTFGDLKYGPDFTPDYVNPDAPKGGEISMAAVGGTWDTLNPYSIKGVPGAGATAPYETILTGTADEIGAAYCLMCKTLEYPADRAWVIFHLRDDVTFADGSPMTAEDVIFSYEQFRDHGLSDFRTILSTQVDKAEVIDPLTVKFTFKAGVPFRDLPAKMGGFPVFSKADFVAKKRSLEDSTRDPFLGTGPYQLDSARTVTGRAVVWKRNPDYWGEALPINKGQNNFDSLRFEYFGDPNAAFEAFKAGTYTFRQESSSKSWATAYDFPGVQDGTVKQEEIANGAKASGQAYVFNLRREKFQDPRVREAISLMFNFEWSNRSLFYGLYTRINSVWENSYLAAQGAPSEAEKAILQPLVDQGLLPAAILTDPPITAPVSGEDQLDRKNLRKASKLLDEAGWEVGDDGLRRKDGVVLTVEILNDNPQFDRVHNPFIENLKALGIDASLKNVDDAQFETRTQPPAFDFDLITSAAHANMEPGDEMRQFYGSETADNSSYNVMGLKSPAVDAMARVVEAAKTKEELVTATQALDRVLLAERFWIPQWYKASVWTAYYDQYGHPEKMPPYALGETSFWWYDAAKGDKLKADGVLR